MKNCYKFKKTIKTNFNNFIIKYFNHLIKVKKKKEI